MKDWPMGETAFDLGPMIKAARNPSLTPEKAESVLLTASWYIDSLPLELQMETARKLVAAMSDSWEAAEQAVQEELVPATATIARKLKPRRMR